MAHFAKLDENNKVTSVIVVNNDAIKNDSGNEDEAVGRSSVNHYMVKILNGFKLLTTIILEKNLLA